MSEITAKEVYELIRTVETNLGNKIDGVRDAFLKLEEGKVTELLESKAKHQAELESIKEKHKTEMLAIRNEYRPVKQIVYGMVAFVMTAVLSAVIYMVIKR